MFDKILLALDGSEGSHKALVSAVELAKRYGSKLHILSVEEFLPSYAATGEEIQQARGEQQRYFERVQSEARELAETDGVEVESEIRSGHAADVILQYAGEQGFDLIVIGTHGHTPVRRFLMGSTCDRVARHAPCSVMVIH